jgi:HEAT repeat protein
MNDLHNNRDFEDDDELGDEMDALYDLDELDGMDDDEYHNEQALYEERPMPTLPETLAALREGERTGATAIVYYGLSDLDTAAIHEVRPVWEVLNVDYRRKVIQQLVDISEMNFDLDYTPLARMAMDDDDAEVRVAAVDLFWGDESVDGMQQMVNLSTQDDSFRVRAAASGALGRYILLGEYGDLPEADEMLAVDTALGIYNDLDEEVDVRRRALEALGHSSLARVVDLIGEAYASNDVAMRASALFAMGKSLDERWADVILRELNSPEAEMRFEAARAAGELMLEQALPRLSRMALEADHEIQEVSIWSLGEIGGQEAIRVLQGLAQNPKVAEDEVLAEAVEDALMVATMPALDGMMFQMIGDDDDGLVWDEDDDDDWQEDLKPDDPSRWN